jgi:hypothetical protein
MSRIIPFQIEGKKMIQLGQLTIDQANDLRSWLPKSSLEKVRYQGLELDECVAFETYDYWFRNYHVLGGSYGTILDF